MEYLHTMIRVTNLDETLDFFCDKLGMVETNRYDSEGGRFTLVFLAASGDEEAAREKKAPLVRTLAFFGGVGCLIRIVIEIA